MVREAEEMRIKSRNERETKAEETKKRLELARHQKVKALDEYLLVDTILNLESYL